MSFPIDPDCVLLGFDPQCGGAHIAGSILRTALFLSAAPEFYPFFRGFSGVRLSEVRFARHRRSRLARRNCQYGRLLKSRGWLGVRRREARERLQVKKPLAWLEPASDLGNGLSG
jgi:hypothetical protein